MSLVAGNRQNFAMGEIVKFVHHGAQKITPSILKGIHKKLPLLKLEFAEIDDPKYPHLAEQLELLTDLLEDFAEGVADDLPYVTVASAAFALIYAHRQFDLIPDSIPEFGHADDSSIVRAVLIEHEKVLADYAEKNGMKWSEITVDA
ncbi:MAG: YkvA family protein [Verrucomicrobiota bacterium]|nr:YkvA family protein [Verrucomicrobiota bacterium]